MDISAFQLPSKGEEMTKIPVKFKATKMSFQARVFGIAQRDIMSVTFFPTTSWYSTYLSWKGKGCQSEEQVEMPTYMKGLGETKEWDREKKRLHAGQGHVGEPLYR